MNLYFRRMRPLLGTFVEIGVAKESVAHEHAVGSAFTLIEEVQNLLSFHDLNSDLSKLNLSCGRPIRLHSRSVVALRLARRMTARTGGYFNCTLGGKMVAIGALPNHDGSCPLEAGVCEDIEIRGSFVKLRRPVKITLDGIAKGYAIDLAVTAMKKLGVMSGWINAGGDLKVFGTAQLPVRRREVDGSLTDLGIFRDVALATSVVTKKFNPRFPGIILSNEDRGPTHGSWTVVAQSAWLADALTKVSATAPKEVRDQLLEIFGARLLPMPSATQQ